MLKHPVDWDFPLSSPELFGHETILLQAALSKGDSHMLACIYKPQSDTDTWLLLHTKNRRLQQIRSPGKKAKYVFSKRDDAVVFGCFAACKTAEVVRYRVDPYLTLQVLGTIGRLGTGLSPTSELWVHSSQSGFCLIVPRVINHYTRQKSSLIETLLVDESAAEPRLKSNSLVCEFGLYDIWFDPFVVKYNNVYCSWRKIQKFGVLRKVHLLASKTEPVGVPTNKI